MDVGDLKSLYLNELQELCDCEARAADILPVVASSAGSAELRRATELHAGRAVSHGRRVEAILRRHGVAPAAGADRVADALVRKAERAVCLAADADLRDAALVAAVRRMNQHRIVAYGAAGSYAETLYLEIDRRGLLANLQEGQAADRRFAGLESDTNRLALLVTTPPY